MNADYFVYDYDMIDLAHRNTWLAGLRPGGLRVLFEHLPSTLFFVKDCELRLMAGNHAFVERCGYACEEDMIGHFDREIFPEELASKYRADDRMVIESAKPLLDLVELFPNQLGEPEWYLTDKVPLFGLDGKVAGIGGTVRSYEGARAALQPYLDLVPVIDYLKNHYRENVSIPEVAKRGGMSVRLLQRRFQATLKTTPRHYIMKLRILAACDLLVNSHAPMTEIALEIGFYDHSVFSRQFTKRMGMAPTEYRRRHLARQD